MISKLIKWWNDPCRRSNHYWKTYAAVHMKPMDWINSPYGFYRICNNCNKSEGIGERYK